MKLNEIVRSNLRTMERKSQAIRVKALPGTAEWEVTELMRSDASGLVASCPLLAEDEIELANAVLHRLNSDPHYYPAAIVLQAIQGINARIEKSQETKRA